MIWTDECTIQLQTHRHFAPQIGEALKPNSWSVSVIHTLVLITLHYIISFLFLHGAFPDGHRFMQDNEPKYTSRLACAFFEDNSVHWWTPAGSPDSNPIENLWHELKEYMRREVKLHNKDELVNELEDCRPGEV